MDDSREVEEVAILFCMDCQSEEFNIFSDGTVCCAHCGFQVLVEMMENVTIH